MVIDKIINNNIVSAFDDTGKEVVVMGGELDLEKNLVVKFRKSRLKKFSGLRARLLQISLKNC